MQQRVYRAPPSQAIKVAPSHRKSNSYNMVGNQQVSNTFDTPMSLQIKSDAS